MKHKVLVADDEENIRRVLGRVLSDYTVLCAEDGEAALRMIASERPSVVLLDLGMPLLSGLGVLCALKGVADAPPVIVVTGDDEIEMAIQALEAGAASYVTKPFNDAVIRLTVQLLIEGVVGVKEGARPWRLKRMMDQPSP
jgi:two-component system KDP operon response regulator KdpE